MKHVIKQIQTSLLGNLVEDVSLSEISKWRIGGRARLVVEPYSIQKLVALIELFNENGIRYVTVGATSNLLFSDAGLDGAVIKIGNHLNKCNVKDDIAYAESGMFAPWFALRMAKYGFCGVEHIAGIPATLGGLIYMNGGSLRKNIGDNVHRVLVADHYGTVVWRSKSECLFDYRTSVFQDGKEIILAAEFKFDKVAPYAIIRTSMLDVMRSRRRKFPLKLPNCGSVFSSSPAMYADVGPPGALIEKAGLKGKFYGGAAVSQIHGNFIVNNGNATSSDVLHLIDYVRKEVYSSTGHKMETEVCYVDSDGSIAPIHRYLDAK